MCFRSKFIFYTFLRQTLRLLLSHLSSFLIYAFHAIKFPWSMAFTVPYVSINCIFFHVLSTTVLFNFQWFGSSSSIFLLLNSNLVPHGLGIYFVSFLFFCCGYVMFYHPKCVPNSMWTLEECVFCYCWMRSPVNANEIKLTDRAVQFSDVLTDFLPAGSISYWWR